MLGEVGYPGLFYQHDSSTGLYEDLVFGAGWAGPSLWYRKLELDPLFAAWIENPLLWSPAARPSGYLNIVPILIGARKTHPVFPILPLTSAAILWASIRSADRKSKPRFPHVR
jgi:hypothetical protein